MDDAHAYYGSFQPISIGYAVKSKVYFYPKNWVVLPVIQMTQSFGYNASLIMLVLVTIYYDSYGKQRDGLYVPVIRKLF